MNDVLKGVLLGVGAMLLLAIAGWLVVAYTGIYDIAASDQHADLVRWTLEKTMHRSVAARADETAVSEPFSREQIAAGAQHYASSCEHCHGAPGRDPAAWSRGLRPEPPDLVEHASEWSAAEIHWITANGIKMTGMPAFGGHHRTEEIEAITALVTLLPALSPAEYAAMAGGGGGGGGGGHSHGGSE